MDKKKKVCTCSIYLHFFFNLRGWKREREREIDLSSTGSLSKHFFLIPVNSQDWARLKPGPGNLIQVSHIGGMDPVPGTITCCLPVSVLTGSMNGSRARIQPRSFLWLMVILMGILTTSPNTYLNLENKTIFYSEADLMHRHRSWRQRPNTIIFVHID